MTTALTKIQQFFSIGESVDRFLLFRIVLGILVLFKITSLSPHWLDFFGENGFFPRDLAQVYSSRPLISYFGITDSLVQYFSITPDQASIAIMYTMGIAAICLMAGLFSRLSVSILLFFHISMMGSFNDYIYGVDYFLASLLFYALFFPLGQKYSLDHYLENKIGFHLSKFRIRSAEATTILGIHLSIVYFVGGITKLGGPTWWNGGAIWTSLERPDLNIAMRFVEYFDIYYLFVALGVATIVVELLYPVMIWFRKTRVVWLALTLGMHLFIGIIMELHYFASVMIFFNLIAFSGKVEPLTFSEPEENTSVVIAA